MAAPRSLRRRWSSFPLRVKVPLVALVPAVPVLALWLLIAVALMRPQAATPSPAVRARPATAAQQRARVVFWTFLAVSLGSVGGGVWLAISLMRGITRRMKMVVQAADNLAAGRPVELTPLGSDEIGHLSNRLHDILLLLRDRERELAHQNRELAVVNEELEAFSYSVSHDLRSPLRAIAGFSQVVEEEAGATLNPEARDALVRVRLATARMNVLIDELLKLSRVARAPLSLQDVDVTGIAHEVADQLRLADPTRTVTVTIAPNIRADGDPALLTVALENLMSNAWKFTGRTPAAEISVTSVIDQREVAVTVKDNGAGFDMAHAKMLFGPFQRLHTQREFTGTGIGLATVQRIARRHGGRVLADAAVGEGAAFTMMLPRAEAGGT